MGTHDDFDIAAERHKEAHQSLDRELAEVALTFFTTTLTSPNIQCE